MKSKKQKKVIKSKELDLDLYEAISHARGFIDLFYLYDLYKSYIEDDWELKDKYEDMRYLFLRREHEKGRKDPIREFEITSRVFISNMPMNISNKKGVIDEK